MHNKDLTQVLFVYAFDTTEFANASHVRRWGRPDDGHERQYLHGP